MTRNEYTALLARRGRAWVRAHFPHVMEQMERRETKREEARP